ncbi:MAG: efflux RND transporter periplasmic adaptor subunit [Pseudomonas sp.]
MVLSSVRTHSLPIILVITALAVQTGCGKTPTPPPKAEPEVSVATVTTQDTPIEFEFTAQSQSSHEVEIRARVDGFLNKRAYTEGQPVQAGQTLFQMDPKPFEAALQTANGQLAQQQARLTVAKANLARVIPLTAQNALSKKDLDDANGSEQQARAEVIAGQGQVQTAQLNLSYTTIKSPISGLSSFARMQEGSYLTATSGDPLTYVYQLDPIWINFSVSENEMLKYHDQIAKGQLRFPANQDFEVSLVLADGSVFPTRGHINFANPAFDSRTGTFLVRAVFDNPKGTLRPGQFVRARVAGAVRPKAVLVPQRAVQQGAKGHFVWVVDKDSKAHPRVVEVGDWSGDNWFILEGLQPGERVIVDGAIRVAPDAQVKIIEAPAAAKPTASAQ